MGRQKLLTVFILIIIGGLAFWFALPKHLFITPTSFVIEDSQGQLLSAAIAADGQWRFPFNSQVPPKFKSCIITFEDKRFEHHPGFDVLAFGRAFRQNIKAKHIVSGGSTLTMQVIRLSTQNERTIWQKLLEIIRAFRLELTYSKKEILALYTSNAPFGSNVVGLDAAAWRYFGRSSDKLSWGEMAALAILPNSPSLVRPGKNRETLLRKRNLLIDKLVTQHQIDATTGALAKLEPVPEQPLPLPQFAPHLLERFRKDCLRSDQKNTRIRTSINLVLQKNVIGIIERHYNELRANDIKNAAALVLDVETGETLAYIGNIYHPNDPSVQSDVDIINSPRSPGSTLKPLLYASMLHDGLILPNSLIPDIPTQIAGYHPENFDLNYDGAVPASKALSRSLNIPAVKMLQQFKYERFHSFLRNIGITTLKKPADFYGLSLILGGGENTLWELTGAYADMARILNHYRKYNGQYDSRDYHNPVYTIMKQSNRILEKTSLLDAASIYYTFKAMEEVMRPAEETLWQQFSSSQTIAWKTGTSFGFRDGWAIGITPKYVVGVWVGNATGEGRPGLIGVKTAAPILFEIFKLLPVTNNGFNMPINSMVKIHVCKESGYRAGEYCNNIDTMWAPQSGVKTIVCPYHQLIHLDMSQKWQVNSSCELPENMVHKYWFTLPPSMEYYYRTKNYEYKVLPPLKPNCRLTTLASPMELIYPKDGARVYIPLEVDGSRGRMICTVAHKQTGVKIFWHLDNEFIGETNLYNQIEISAGVGKHSLTLVDSNGNRLESHFEVIDKYENK